MGLTVGSYGTCVFCMRKRNVAKSLYGSEMFDPKSSLLSSGLIWTEKKEKGKSFQNCWISKTGGRQIYVGKKSLSIREREDRWEWGRKIN